jgi:hypothetical protein
VSAREATSRAPRTSSGAPCGTARSTLTTTFRSARERHTALGVSGAVSGLGGAVIVLAGAAVALLAPNTRQTAPALEEEPEEEPALDLAA